MFKNIKYKASFGPEETAANILEVHLKKKKD